MLTRAMLAALLIWALVAAAQAACRAEPPIGGTLLQSATQVLPGEKVRLEARALDQDTLMGPDQVPVSTVGDPVRFSWSASGGTFASQDPPGQNPNRAVWVPPVQPGRYTIIATADDVNPREGGDDTPWQGIAVVTVGPPAPGLPPTGQLTLRVDPDRLPADGRSTARVIATLGGRGNAGKPVQFTTTLGTISPSQAVTNREGAAYATLRAPQSGGLGTVTVSAGNLVAQAFVEAVPQIGPGPGTYPVPVPVPVTVGQVLVTPSPAALPADGRSQAALNIMVLDPFGRAVAFAPVALAATAGRVGPYAVTDGTGRAQVLLEAPAAPGPAAITAWTSLGSGQATVQFNPLQVKLTASPDQVPADGESVVRLIARVTDSQGTPVADGTPVSFTGTEGKGTTVGTRGGVASAQVPAPTAPERATITARALSVSDTTTINFTRAEDAAPSGATLRLGANPSLLPADGKAIAVISVLLVGAEGKPLAGKTVVLATTAGTITQTVTSDEHGKATATLTAGNQPAEALVSAEAEGTVAAVSVRFE